MKAAAVIVAHPDDEIIWCGGLILQHPDWDWTVLSLCRAADPSREPRFRSVCAHLGVTGFISDLDDGDPPAPIDPGIEIGRRISECVAERPWDLCVTHGANGEYGHPRHKEVHAEVARLTEDGVLRCRELWTFACECDARTAACRPSPGADLLIHLTAEQLAKKKQIVHKEYGYGADTFEVRACVSPESFRRERIMREDRRS